jgi:hypothetical protein
MPFDGAHRRFAFSNVASSCAARGSATSKPALLAATASPKSQRQCVVIPGHLSFVESSAFNKLCDLIFTCLIRVRLPDFVE